MRRPLSLPVLYCTLSTLHLRASQLFLRPLRRHDPPSCPLFPSSLPFAAAMLHPSAWSWSTRCKLRAAPRFSTHPSSLVPWSLPPTRLHPPAWLPPLSYGCQWCAGHFPMRAVLIVNVSGRPLSIHFPAREHTRPHRASWLLFPLADRQPGTCKSHILAESPSV